MARPRSRSGPYLLAHPAEAVVNSASPTPLSVHTTTIVARSSLNGITGAVGTRSSAPTSRNGRSPYRSIIQPVAALVSRAASAADPKTSPMTVPE